MASRSFGGVAAPYSMAWIAAHSASAPPFQAVIFCSSSGDNVPATMPFDSMSEALPAVSRIPQASCFTSIISSMKASLCLMLAVSRVDSLSSVASSSVTAVWYSPASCARRSALGFTS